MENKISLSIPDAVQKQVLLKITELKGLLAPYLIALTPQQRGAILKMGDRSQPFVDKSLEYAQRNPNLLPSFLNLAEWKKDTVGRKNLSDMQYALSELNSNVADTNMQCGSEAYNQALLFYNNVKQAAKNNVPDAKVIAEELSKRFSSRPAAQEPPAS
ncbi:hypothetical protein [Collimonas sp.]|uniref:hypothetical protein n=1 Tax=Collimonas sp. TaxID=1963772 RepID=UPI002CDBC9CB|nr:hypothetical protein [Collimonas sp.]HWW04842.1 hypothetical protein [Collimonas sp.]